MASSRGGEICESQLDRHVKEPLVREALVLVYYSMIRRYTETRTHESCHCRRIVESNVQHDAEHKKEKEKKKLRTRRLSGSPTQISRFSRRKSESKQYVYLSLRKLQQGQTASCATENMPSSTGALWLRSLSQGDHALFCKSTIPTGKKGSLYETTQTAGENNNNNNKRIVFPLTPLMTPPPVLAVGRAADLPPHMPDMAFRSALGSAVAAPESSTERFHPCMKKAASLWLHYNGSTQGMRGFSVRNGPQPLPLPERPGADNTTGKRWRAVSLNTSEREHKTFYVKKGFRFFEWPYTHTHLQQQTPLSLKLLGNTSAISQQGKTCDVKKISGSTVETGDVSEHTPAHHFSSEGSPCCSSVRDKVSFAPRADGAATSAFQRPVHGHGESAPRSESPTILSKGRKKDADVYCRRQKHEGRNEVHDKSRPQQRGGETTTVQRRDNTFTDTLSYIPSSQTTPELCPKEKFILLIRAGTNVTPATTAIRGWTPTSHIPCPSACSGRDNCSTRHTLVSHIDTLFTSEACNLACSHAVNRVHTLLSGPTCCGDATPGSAACTSVNADAGAASGTANCPVTAAAEPAERPAALSADDCVNSTSPSIRGVIAAPFPASSKAAERDGVLSAPTERAEVLWTSRHEIASSHPPSIGEEADAGDGLILPLCTSGQQMVSLLEKKEATFPRVLRSRASTPSRSSRKALAVTEISPHSGNGRSSSCSNKSLFPRSAQLCQAGRASRTESCEARPRWSSASTTFSRSSSLQSRNKACCCNLNSALGMERQERCTLCSSRPAFNEETHGGSEAERSAAATTAEDAEQKPEDNGSRRQVRRFHDPLRTVDFDRKPMPSTEKLKDAPEALRASEDATACFVVDGVMTDQLCIWEPLSVIPPSPRCSSHVQGKDPQSLLHFSGPLLLDRGRRLFERLTCFPARRVVQLDDWARLCSQSGLQELLYRLWVTGQSDEQGAAILTEGSDSGMRKTVRTCRRFQQRPLNKRDLILLYMRQQKEEMHTQASAAALDNCGLTFWSFWEMVCLLSALTDLLFVRYRPLSSSEPCSGSHRDFAYGVPSMEHRDSSPNGRMVREHSPLMSKVAIEERASHGEVQQNSTITHRFKKVAEVHRATPDAKAHSMEQPGTINNAEKSVNGTVAMRSEEGRAAVFYVSKNATASESQKWSKFWNSGQVERKQVLLPFSFQKPSILASIDVLSEDKRALESSLDANPFTLHGDMRGQVTVLPDERIFVPWMPDIRRGYYSMTSEQRIIAVNCLLSFFGV